VVVAACPKSARSITVITLVYPVHPEKRYRLDLSCPVTLCDACGKPIDAEHPGLLSYTPDDRHHWHVHKGACDRAVEKAAGVDLLTRELDVWLNQLVNNYKSPLIGNTIPFGDDCEEVRVVAVKRFEDGEEITAATQPEWMHT
jgi:hypothetical protein